MPCSAKSSLAWKLIAGIAVALTVGVSAGPPGGAVEPVRYVGEAAVERGRHDGALPLVVGTHSFQILRANRGQPDLGNGKGWTYSHSPNAAWWKGRFYCESTTLPVNESDWPPRGHANRILTWSDNGRDWETPVEAFPYVPIDGLPGMAGKHSEQISRSAFYIASNGRLLITTSLGTSGNKAIGRLVREIKDTIPPTFGETYFIRYYNHAGFSADNTVSTGLTAYQSSTDPGFKDACEELLTKVFVTENWWEDELNSQREEGPLRPADGFYKVPYKDGELDDNLVKAMWTFQRADGNWLAGWKNGAFAVYNTPAGTWSPPRIARTIVTSSAKSWGQRTPDSRYALVYNPTSDGYRRWPLSMVSSDDGIYFDHLGTIVGDVPWPRYRGGNKELGPQYARGIEPWNGSPPGDGMWIFHSVNKEDLWATRVPTPALNRVTERVRDDFEAATANAAVIPSWNVYRPKWAPVEVVEFQGGKRLRLRDHEPYDYAKAARVFPETSSVTVSLKVRPSQSDGQLDIDLLTPDGYRPVRLSFSADGQFKGNRGGDMESLGPYESDVWTEITIKADATAGTYRVTVGNRSYTDRAFAEPATSLGRLELRTGDFRTVPILGTNPYAPADLPNSEIPTHDHAFHIDDVITSPGASAPRLLQAFSVGDSRISLIFDQPLEAAPDAASFTISPAIPIANARVDTSGKKVLLSLASALVSGTTYTVGAGITHQSQSVTVPTSPPSANLRLWLHAGAGVTTEEDGTVRHWADQSPAGNTVHNPTAGPDSKPRLVPGMINGHSVVQFDGGDYLQREVSGIIADKAVVFIVFKAHRPAKHQFLFDTAEDGQLSRHQIHLNADWLQFRVDKNGGTIDQNAYADNAFILATFVLNGSASFSRINGTNHRVGAFSDLGNHGRYTQIPAANGSPFVLGARYTRDSGFYEGELAEILIYDQVQAPAETRDVEAYLLNKYSLQP